MVFRVVMLPIGVLYVYNIYRYQPMGKFLSVLLLRTEDQCQNVQNQAIGAKMRKQ